MIFFHKFFLIKKNFTNLKSKYFSCIACLLLSLKVNDYLIPFDSFINLSISFFYKKKQIKILKTKENFEILSKNDIDIENIYSIEQEILFEIGFDLNIDLPLYKDPKIFEYFLNFEFEFIKIKFDDLLRLYFALLNDSFKLPFILYYEPHYIQIACIYMFNLLFDIKLPPFDFDFFNGKKFYFYGNKNENENENEGKVNDNENEGKEVSIDNDFHFGKIKEICDIFNIMNSFSLKGFHKSDIEFLKDKCDFEIIKFDINFNSNTFSNRFGNKDLDIDIDKDILDKKYIDIFSNGFSNNNNNNPSENKDYIIDLNKKNEKKKENKFKGSLVESEFLNKKRLRNEIKETNNNNNDNNNNNNHNDNNNNDNDNDIDKKIEINYSNLISIIQI